MSHERRGMARGVMKRARRPARGERKDGEVKRAVRTNWAKVINGPCLLAVLFWYTTGGSTGAGLFSVAS